MDWDRFGDSFRVFRFYSFILGIAIITLFLSSCASSERMMRLSPFRHQQQSPTGPVSSKSQITAERHSGADDFDTRFKNHVNLWPLLYSEGNFTSALWPMIDFDPNGMAIRPFYNREKDEYSILFPLSAWNPRNGDGWLLTGYWDKPAGDYGIFPLYHIGKDKQQNLKDLYLLSFLLGHYSVMDNDGYRFSALNYLQRNYNDKFFSSLLPLYYYSAEDNDSYLWMLNSFYNRNSHKGITSFTFLPISYYKSTPDKLKFWLLNAYYGKKDEETRHLFFPLYWYYNNGSEYWMNFLILSGFKYDRSLKKLWFMPLFYYNDEGFTWVMMYYKDDMGSFGIAPLFNYKSRNDAWDMILWPLLSFISSSPSENSGNLLLNFMGYDFKKKNPGNTLWFWPLFYYNQQERYRDPGSAPYLFKYVNCSYYPYLFNYKKEDLQKAGIPPSTQKSFNAIIFHSSEEYYYSFSFPGEKQRCFPGRTCHPKKKSVRHSQELTIFPFISSRKESQSWDKNKLDDGINSLEERLKLLNEYRSYLKNHNKYMEQLAKHEFGSKFNFYSNIFKLAPMSPEVQQPPDFRNPKEKSLEEKEKDFIQAQLESFNKQSEEGLKRETSALKTIMKSHNCGNVDINSQPELLKALFSLQERYSIQTKETSSMLFPLFQYSESPIKNSLWVIPFYKSNNTEKQSISNGIFPLYHYSDSPLKSKLILWPLLSGGSTNTISPNCGFPDSIFAESMKKAGLKDGKNNSTLSLLVCPTKSEKNNNILPSPYSPLATQSYSQIFWMFNRWGETSKSWTPSKIKQIKELLSAIAMLVDLKYWQPADNKKAHNSSTRLYRSNYKFKLPKDRETWTKRGEIKLKKSLEEFGYHNINIKSKDALMKVLVEIDLKYTTETTSSHILIPTLFYHSSEANNEYWNILLLLSDYEKKGSYSKFSILKYLLRIEEKNDKYSCDVFPFINYSSENTQSSFSFMWRLFRLEKSSTKTQTRHKLYLFFIPFEW